MIPANLHLYNQFTTWFQPTYIFTTSLQHDSSQPTLLQPVYNMIPTSLHNYNNYNQFITWFQPADIITTSLQHDNYTYLFQ